VLAGCASPPAIDANALPTTPPAWKAEAPTEGRWSVVAPADTQPRGEWWRAFADPVLDDLEQRAMARNDDLQVAASRLAEARALLRNADAARLPQVGAGAGVSRGTLVTGSPVISNLGQAGLNASYEVDLVGRLSLASRAALFDVQSRVALLESTRLMVQADVAQAYLALRFADLERHLVRDTVAAYRETLALTQRRFDAGDVAELDLVRLQGEVAATEADALAQDRRRALLENALAVLLGEPASGFVLAEADGLAPVPAVPAGLPSDVLARRPDVAAAQRTLMAAQARVGVAQAAWLPSLSLTGAGGVASPELGDVFRWSARAWSVGALLSLPLFDGGRRQAGIEAARAQLDGALADYRRQVLQSLREVEDQLVSLQGLQREATVQAQAVQAAVRATTLSETRWRNGRTSQLDLLDARRSELRNRRAALQVQAGQYQATVGLVRALGGGWVS
jgi:multidrug efflux system outer membrane protein